MSSDETKASTASTKSVPTVKLANGVEIPQVGSGCAFGNWTGGTSFQGFLPELAWRSTTLAYEAGLRHFDGAYAYGTQRHLGDVLGRYMAKGQLKREDVFLTTKLCHPRAPGHVSISPLRTWNPREYALETPEDKEKGRLSSLRQRVQQDLYVSLDECGVGQFDLVLMHWPGDFAEKDASYARKVRAEVWRQFEAFLKLGVARAIGVCNFTKKHLQELMEDTDVKPMVNQVEIHPYCRDSELVDFCKAQGIVVEAFAPFASGAFDLLKDEVLVKIAEKVGRSVGQVILRWHVQLGHVILPKSSNPKRMAQNIELFDFELSDDDMKAINALQKAEPRRTCPDPQTIV